MPLHISNVLACVWQPWQGTTLGSFRITGARSGFDAIEAVKCSGVISVGPGFHPLSTAKLEGFVHQRLANAGNKM